MKRSTIIIPIALLIAVAFLVVDRSRATTNNPEEAAKHPAFIWQGEYVGNVTFEGEEMPAGAQVVALPEGKFQCVLYRGGLPGDGWNGEEPVRIDGQVMHQSRVLWVRFEDEQFLIRLQNGELHLSPAFDPTVRPDEPTVTGELKKTVRTSPTLGAKPPEGATVLFDGTEASLDNWTGAKMTDDGLLIEGATTRESFGDMQLHLEFRLPFTPELQDQKRGNSGVYIQNRYEVQILDSFGLPPQPSHAGGLYRHRPPDINMSYPPMTWQTYDIDFTAPRFDDAGNKTANARITVRHNGVVIHDDVELPHGTGAGRGRGEVAAAPLILQNHSDPVRFRNVWVVTPAAQ